MSDEEMNAAIHSAIGRGDEWLIVKRGLFYRPNAHGYTSNEQDAWRLSEQDAKLQLYPHGDEPVTMQRASPADYANDLNAMHEAEKVLTPVQLTDYGCTLMFCEPREFAGIRSTARQRATAFLKTIKATP